MLTFYYINVFLHVFSACVWIGGLTAILVDGRHDAWMRFRPWAWFSLLTSVATGILNLMARGYGWNDVWNGVLWKGGFGETLAVKMVLVTTQIIILIFIGYARIAANRLPAFIKALLIVGVAIIMCAVFLIRGRPW